MITTNATRNVAGRPEAWAVALAKRVNHEADFVAGAGGELEGIIPWTLLELDRALLRPQSTRHSNETQRR
jgi:hypothetical protein